MLAEVASGGEAEVNAAVAAAKAAFPHGRQHPLRNAPSDAQAGRTDSGTRARNRANGNQGLRPDHLANWQTADSPRGGQLHLLCRNVHPCGRPHLPNRNAPELHAFPPGRCVRAGQPVERAFHDRDLESRALSGVWQHRRVENERTLAHDCRTLGELALEAGIPAGVLNVVHGYGKEAGEPLCSHPDVRAISFTGSTATGNRIVQAAGLKKISMELGGKSPFVIFADADLDRALDAAIFMIFSNNGERCTAGSRILVQQSIYADFAQKFAERAKRITVGDPLDEKTIVGPMISQAHLAKVRSYIELGPKEGATLLCGGLGTPDLPDHVKRGNFVLPTVFADVDNRMRIAQEEIFGPVACLIPFKDEADAIRLANNISYGLSSYVWTRTVKRRLHPVCRGGWHVLCQQPERAGFAPTLRRHQGQRHRARRRHLELRGVL